MTSGPAAYTVLKSDQRLRRFGFLLLDQYPMLPVAGMMDILRDSEYVTGQSKFDWITISEGANEVVAMNNLRARADYTIDDAPDCDVVVVCAGLGGHLIETPRVIRWLQSQYAKNVMIGSIATGTWILAKAGLLSNHRCTIHWEDIPAFEESYPLIEVSRTLYVRDGQIFTCTGGTAAIDLFLELISENLGPEVSADVARQILHQSTRIGSEVLPIKDSPFMRTHNPELHRATAIMHENLENPVPIQQIAKRVGVSQKQLERLFRNFFHTTPQLHYRAVRLDHARALVRLTNFEVWQIAIMAGFSSAQYFSRSYRERFAASPSQERKTLVRYFIPGDS